MSPVVVARRPQPVVQRLACSSPAAPPPQLPPARGAGARLAWALSAQLAEQSRRLAALRQRGSGPAVARRRPFPPSKRPSHLPLSSHPSIPFAFFLIGPILLLLAVLPRVLQF
eukprot:9467782-Pyramimonas_sp.AAC.2